MSDLELLQQYTRTNSQDAFAALVERHVHFVYSAARRQVRSPELADEIAQSVFLDLARQGHRLDATQPLAAWLFLVTRRKAIDVIRRESRRAVREQTAAEIAALKTPSPSWTRIKDVLDEALEALHDADRTALLLRFFENRSLREVGAALGISDDTAQKRVASALDRLRALLERRGAVAASVTALATDLSAHAVEAAPATVGTTISSTAFFSSAPTTAATFSSAQSTIWSAFQKSFAVLAVTSFLGFVAFEATTFARQRTELATIPDQATRLTATLAAVQSEHAAISAHLPTARATLAEASRPRIVDAELEAAIEAWLARVKRLQELAAERADLATPEFAVLTEREWFFAAKDAKLETEPELRETFKTLRNTARDAFAERLDDALDRYLAAHHGNLPDSPEQLSAHATSPLPFELLCDYEMLQRGPISAVPKDAWLFAEHPAAAARHGNRVYVSAEKRGTAELTAPTLSTP